MKIDKKYLVKAATLSAILGIVHGKTQITCMEENDSKCSVCEENVDVSDLEKPGVCTPCGHKFHSNCLKIWLKEKNICPNCRSTTNEGEIINLSGIPYITKHTLEASFGKTFSDEQCRLYNELFADYMLAERKLACHKNDPDLLKDLNIRKGLFEEFVDKISAP